MTNYEITCQDLIFRREYPSTTSNEKLYPPRIVKYIKDAFFIWGRVDPKINKLLKEKQETEIVKHINNLISRTIDYKSSLFTPPEAYHLSTERVYSVADLRLYNKRHNLPKNKLHNPSKCIPAAFANNMSICGILYDLGSPIINVKQMGAFNLSPLVFRVGEMFWNIDQLFMALSEIKSCKPYHIDALNRAIYEHFIYLGELYGYFLTYSKSEGSKIAANKKNKLQDIVKKIYEQYRKGNNIKHPTTKQEEQKIIAAIKEIYHHQTTQELNRSDRWFTERIF